MCDLLTFSRGQEYLGVFFFQEADPPSAARLRLVVDNYHQRPPGKCEFSLSVSWYRSNSLVQLQTLASPCAELNSRSLSRLRVVAKNEANCSPSSLITLYDPRPAFDLRVNMIVPCTNMGSNRPLPVFPFCKPCIRLRIC